MRDFKYCTYRVFWAFAFKDRAAGIPVGSLFPSAAEKHTAIPKVVAALLRIREVDPRRFERIQRQVARIQLLGSRLVALGSWYNALSMIMLAGDWVEAASTSPDRIALTIVHEATHARLMRFGYAEDIRARIERICNYQELVFASRIAGASELIASARRAMDTDPSGFTSEDHRQRSLKALATLGVPKWIIRLLDRVTRSRAA